MSNTSTLNRVPAHTDEVINRRIRAETERRLAYFEKHKDEIPERLADLDREWDIERTLEAQCVHSRLRRSSARFYR